VDGGGIARGVSQSARDGTADGCGALHEQREHVETKARRVLEGEATQAGGTPFSEGLPGELGRLTDDCRGEGLGTSLVLFDPYWRKSCSDFGVPTDVRTVKKIENAGVCDCGELGVHRVFPLLE
jgi:hypothetical protein